MTSPSPRPSSPHRPVSKRFDPSIWSARIVPAVMVILALALILSLAVVILSMLGLTPAF